MGSKRGWIAIVLAFCAGLATPAFARAPAACRPNPNRPFRVFDGTSFAQRPDLSRQGLAPIHIVDRGIWPNDDSRSGAPDAVLLRRTLARLPNDGAPVVIDVEEFDPATPNAAAATAAILRLTQIQAAFKAAGPRRAYGYYGILPGRDYWRAIRGAGSPEYRAWQRENDRLAPLERRMDVLFPSLYAFYDDPRGWVAFATAQICEARRISSKPVYVFLWFEYHPSSMGAGHFIPASYWRLQLETVRGLADGVVIWGGYDMAARRARIWDSDAPWWRETVRFVNRLDRR